MPPPSSRSASPAADIAAALGARAEAVCRRYLPQGRKQGRYWVAGDLEGARGRSLFVRLHGPGVPGKVDRRGHRRARRPARSRPASLGRARRFARRSPRARAFLALPASPASGESYDATRAARRLWRRCRAIPCRGLSPRPRARALPVPGIALPSRASLSRRLFPAPFSGAGRRRDGDDGATRRAAHLVDPRLPAKADVAAPRKALGRIHGRAVRFGRPAAALRCSSAKASRPCRSSPRRPGSFRRPRSRPEASARSPACRGVARLVIARDNDSEGERAAQRLARRCARAGVAAHVIVSEYGDFNDDLVTLGPRALALRLAALFRTPQRVGEREGRGGGGVNAARSEIEVPGTGNTQGEPHHTIRHLQAHRSGRFAHLSRRRGLPSGGLPQARITLLRHPPRRGFSRSDPGAPALAYPRGHRATRRYASVAVTGHAVFGRSLRAGLSAAISGSAPIPLLSLSPCMIPHHRFGRQVIHSSRRCEYCGKLPLAVGSSSTEVASRIRPSPPN